MLSVGVKPSSLVQDDSRKYLGVKMPFSRRQRPRQSSLPAESLVEVEGTAILCFPEDGQCFIGTISGDADDSYSIYAKRLPTTPTSNNNNNGEEEKDLNEAEYSLALTDHFTGIQHEPPTIRVMILNNAKVVMKAAQGAKVSFEVTRTFRGERAAMMMQQCGGQSTFFGQQCLVFQGHFRIAFNEPAATPMSWSL